MPAPTVSVCIPVRNEAQTVGAIVGALVERRCHGPHAAADVVVVDDASTDDSAAVARAAGARVVPNAHTSGKGGALRTAVEVTSGEVLCFLDGDVRGFDASVLDHLLAPMADPGVVLVKPRYRRPLWGRPGEGGRVTELVARPLLARLRPDLAAIEQPLAGESVVRRAALDGIDLADGYGIEVALLMDVAARFGADAIAQVDLGERAHRNRPLRELRGQADEVIEAVLARCAAPPPSTPAPNTRGGVVTMQ